jgi:hypothetical protein
MIQALFSPFNLEIIQAKYAYIHTVASHPNFVQYSKEISIWRMQMLKKKLSKTKRKA